MVMLKAGCILGPPEIAVAASAGLARVRVSSQPAFMIVSTGNELVEPGEPIAAQQVRRSNAYAVAATLRAGGFGRVGDDHVPDDEEMLRERLKLHLTTHDVVILSGGVSMGKFDFVPPPLSYFLPVSIEHDAWGRPWANPRPTNGSGDFLSLAGTDGFFELPPGPNSYPKGFVANLYRW
jgi:molybdopterin molybdotransferase